MKYHAKVFYLTVAFLFSGIITELSAKETEWVRIPSHWLLSRFVRSSVAPAKSYKIALIFPPGSHEAKIAQSSGSSDVDQLATDFALESVRKGPLKDLAKTKELYFQFVVTPPMLDVKMRSKEGKRPMPPDKELYTPSAETIFIAPNQNDDVVRRGKVAVFFPPEGGYAQAAVVTVSTGSAAVDRYELHNAALNWQTSHKSSDVQVLRTDYGVSNPPRWRSINDR